MVVTICTSITFERTHIGWKTYYEMNIYDKLCQHVLFNLRSITVRCVSSSDAHLPLPRICCYAHQRQHHNVADNLRYRIPHVRHFVQRVAACLRVIYAFGRVITTAFCNNQRNFRFSKETLSVQRQEEGISSSIALENAASLTRLRTNT